MGCFYTDACDAYNDIAPYDVVILPKVLHVALCDSRHEIPLAVNGSIFPETILNPTDFRQLADMCEQTLNPAMNVGVNRINLYVTGLSTALLTVVNYCHENRINLITWHYNRNTGEYVALQMK